MTLVILVIPVIPDINMNRQLDIFRTWWVAAVAALFCSCSMIDEDLSDCGEELRISYDLHLVTNMSIELQAQLDKRSDAHLIAALRSYLSPIFMDFAHDIDLSFYEVKGDSARLFHEQEEMNAHQMGFTLYLPRRNYMNTAVANVQGNGVTVLDGDDYCHTARLRQSSTDTITNQKTGLFTAREMIRMADDAESNSFQVRLYMANCAAALVLDPREVGIDNLSMVATGFASRFCLADSAYVFPDVPFMVKPQLIEAEDTKEICFCTVNFPSRDFSPERSRTIVETEEPFVSADAAEALWQMRVYVTLADGKVTETVLGIHQPLRAGQLKIVKGWVAVDGSIRTADSEVSTSVTLDWKEGLVVGG